MATANRPSSIANRTQVLVILGAPFALLLASSISSWPWRSLDFPGSVGSLVPPTLGFLSITVIGGLWAFHKMLPVGLITWVPAGQGALVLLATGAVANSDSALLGIAVMVAYVFLYLIVLGVALAISGKSPSLGIALVSFFVLTQAARFPVFGVDSAVTLANAHWLTLAACLLAIFELTLLTWLARRLIEAPKEQEFITCIHIVILVVAHGLVASWEDPLLRGQVNLTEIGEQFTRWLLFASMQLGLAFGLIRVRNAMSRVSAWDESVNDSKQTEKSADLR